MTTLQGNITGYWPYKPGLTPAQSRMEGGTHDRKGRPITTLEMYQQGIADYVSVAGDFTIWPDGQRLELSNWPGVVFRVVDTGGNFYDSAKTTKRYRSPGREPFDVAVSGPNTPVQREQTVTVVDGDSFGGGQVQYARLDMYKVGYEDGGGAAPFDDGEGDLFAAFNDFLPTETDTASVETNDSVPIGTVGLVVGIGVALAIIVALG